MASVKLIQVQEAGSEGAHYVLDVSVIKAIEQGSLSDITTWHNEVVKTQPRVVINQIVDTRDEVIVQLKSEVNTKGMTALSYAAFYNQYDIVDFLLKNGADPSVTNVKEETALHTAMQSDGEDEDICKIVSRLLTDRTDYVNAVSTENWTPLLVAVTLDLPQTVELLLSKGANPNVHTEEEDKDILALAAENGGEILEMLLKNGSITMPDRINKIYGTYTPLHIAVLRLQINSVRLLIEHGADPAIQDEYGCCPVHYVGEAKTAGDFRQFVSLLKKSLNQKDGSNGYTLLHMMVLDNKKDYVRILREVFNADYKVKDKMKRLPLHYLAECRGNQDLVECLSDRYALTLCDEDGYTVLHRAVKQLDHELVAVLLPAEARAIDTSDLLPGKGCKETDAHNSVLHIATVAEGSDTDYEKLLCAFQEEMGSDFKKLREKVDGEKRTALHLAMQHNMFSRVVTLLDKKADPGAKTAEGDGKGGQNLIHLATLAKGTAVDFKSVIGKIYSKFPRKLKELIDVRDGAGRTALHLAIEHRYYARVEILLDYDANPLIKAPCGSNLLHMVTVTAVTDGEFERIINKIKDSLPHESKGDMKHFIDEKNGSFKTALHLAVEGKKWNRAETLLGFDADYSKTDDSGTNSFQIALKYKSPRKFLLQLLRIQFVENMPRGSQSIEECSVAFIHRSGDSSRRSHSRKESSIVNKKWNEALRHAVERDRYDIVKDLLVKGAQISTNDLLEALKHDKSELACILVRHAGPANIEDVLNESIPTPKYGTTISEPDSATAIGVAAQNLSKVRRWLKDFCPYLPRRSEYTTLFRELISRMPDVAKEALERCVYVNKTEKEVLFYYGFIQKDDDRHRSATPVKCDEGSFTDSDRERLINLQSDQDSVSPTTTPELKLADPLQVDYQPNAQGSATDDKNT